MALHYSHLIYVSLRQSFIRQDLTRDINVLTSLQVVFHESKMK